VDQSEAYVLELMPLLRLSIEATNLDIKDGIKVFVRFGDKLVSRLLGLSEVLIWKEFLHKPITSMSFTIGSPHKPRVLVKAPATADWMPWDSTVSHEGRPRKERGAATFWMRRRASLGGFPMPFVEGSKE
jgi:hypothetical protein